LDVVDSPWYSTTALFEAELMACKSCSSEHLQKLSSEMILHFSGLKRLDQPPIFATPEIVVCIDCGFAEFAIPETVLCQLAKDPPSQTKSSPDQYLSFLRSSATH
jgi:hypothetical protein